MRRFKSLSCLLCAVVTVVVLQSDAVVCSGLSPEEEHRLVMKADASVIDEKLKEMPFGVLMAPAPLDEHSLPVPTMDPPLPEGSKQSVQITTATGLGSNKSGPLSERIRNAMKVAQKECSNLSLFLSRFLATFTRLPCFLLLYYFHFSLM